MNLIADTVQGRGRLTGCLAISLCLHAGLLVAWQYPAPLVPAAAPASSAIEVVLVARRPDTPVPATRARVAPARPVQNRERTPPSEAAAQALARTPAPTATETESTPAPPRPAPAADATPPSPPAATVNEDELRAQVEALLLADLARHFEYPSVARRRGWQGMVTVAMKVQADGALEEIRVSQTSGYVVLDAAAVDTLRRIGRVPQVRQLPGWRSLDLLLPVVYRLTD